MLQRVLINLVYSDPTLEYNNSPFFTEQLTAFEVWLEFGSEKKRPPEQLPIVLQVHTLTLRNTTSALVANTTRIGIA